MEILLFTSAYLVALCKFAVAIRLHNSNAHKFSSSLSLKIAASLHKHLEAGQHLLGNFPMLCGLKSFGELKIRKDENCSLRECIKFSSISTAANECPGCRDECEGIFRFNRECSQSFHTN